MLKFVQYNNTNEQKLAGVGTVRLYKMPVYRSKETSGGEYSFFIYHLNIFLLFLGFIEFLFKYSSEGQLHGAVYHNPGKPILV